MVLLAGPIARLLGSVEDERLLTEHEVGPRALAVHEQRRIESDIEQDEIGAGLHARIGLGRGARGANGSAAAARAHIGQRAADGQRNAHAVAAARIHRARVGLLAHGAGEAGRAVALELKPRQVRAAAVVQTWARLAAERLLDVEVAALRVSIVDEMLRAVHNGELAEAVADDELEVVGRMRDQVAGLGVHAQLAGVVVVHHVGRGHN